MEEFWSIEKTPEKMSSELSLKMMKVGCVTQINSLLNEKENIPVDYVAKDLLRHAYIDGKGRGLRAVSDIAVGTLLVVDRMIYSCQKFTGDHFELAQSHETAKRVIFGDRNSLIAKLLNLFKYDGLLAKKFQMLDYQRYSESKRLTLPLIEDLPGFAYRSCLLICHHFSLKVHIRSWC